jgi:hypothetical protein
MTLLTFATLLLRLVSEAQKVSSAPYSSSSSFYGPVSLRMHRSLRLIVLTLSLSFSIGSLALCY